MPRLETIDEQIQNDLPEREAAFNPDDKKPMASGFAISVAVHCAVLFLFSLVVIVSGIMREEEAPPLRIPPIEPPPVTTTDATRQVDEKIEVPPTEFAEDEVKQINPFTPLEAVDPVTSTEDEDYEVLEPKGRPEAVATSEDGATGVGMSIGAGHDASGMYGKRKGGGPGRMIAKTKWPKSSLGSTDAALRWLKRHQSPDGRWDTVNYPNNCVDGGKCEPGDPGPWCSKDAVDVAATGYALMAFLGGGYDHRTPSKFKDTVKKGVDFLLSAQKADGLLGERNYEHPIATMALCEAYAMANDPALREPAQKAVNVILSRQNKDANAKDAAYGGLGWDYTNPTARNDASVSGWNIMALKDAKAAHLSVGNAMEGASTYLRKAWEACNPDFRNFKDPYHDQSTFPYTWDSQTNAVLVEKGADHHDMAPVGAMCAVFLGSKAGDPMLESLCNYITEHQLPTSYPCNTYYLYYNLMAIYQAGGERWKKWNPAVPEMLIAAQRKTKDCFDGSWDYVGTKFPGHTAGRIFSTALCCLCMEVVWRDGKLANGAKAW